MQPLCRKNAMEFEQDRDNRKRACLTFERDGGVSDIMELRP